jgi:uncharacterized OB-fold protein
MNMDQRLNFERIAGKRPYPPRITEFTRPFWEALAEGRFLATRCGMCARFSFPPKPFCPHCWERRVEWMPLAPRGTVYSSTVIHAAPQIFAHEAPYRVAIIDLVDSVRIATRLIGAHDFAIGRSVEIVTLQYEDGPLFAARPL